MLPLASGHLMRYTVKKLPTLFELNNYVGLGILWAILIVSYMPYVLPLEMGLYYKNIRGKFTRSDF